jgi:hypothetical protein
LGDGGGVGGGAAGVEAPWSTMEEQMVVVLRRAGSGDLSLLSSVPGRPRSDGGEKGWTLLGQKALSP